MVAVLVPKFSGIARGIYMIAVLSWALCLRASLRSAFAEYYRNEVYSSLLKQYGPQFLRYLIFRAELSKDIADDAQAIGSMRESLKNEADLTNTSVISQHPVTVICIGFLTAIVSGGASQPIFWTSGIAWLAIGLLLAIIFMNNVLTEVIKSNANKSRELQLFLHWLSMEERKS